VLPAIARMPAGVRIVPVVSMMACRADSRLGSRARKLRIVLREQDPVVDGGAEQHGADDLVADEIQFFPQK
jgi:hypothetical protein